VDTANYSVQIRRGFRECVTAVYRESSGEFLFEGELSGKKWETICLGAPKNLSEKDLSRVVSNLSAALSKLSYEFVIFKRVELGPVPENERQAAIADLKSMGYDLVVNDQNSSIQLRQRQPMNRPGLEETRREAVRQIGALRLARTATGKRHRIDILAKSEAADTSFI
jgi:hypothetical protein